MSVAFWELSSSDNEVNSANTYLSIGQGIFLMY